MIDSKIFLLSLILDDVNEAYNLIKDLEPTTPQEYILKGVVNAALGQDQGSVRQNLTTLLNVHVEVVYSQPTLCFPCIMSIERLSKNREEEDTLTLCYKYIVTAE